MASILRVNTITDASSYNSISSSIVASGSAKTWFNYTMVTTTAYRDSFNCSGITDNGTGDTTIAFTSSFSNNDYALSLAHRRNSTTEGQSITPHQDTAFGTGEIRLATEGAEDFLLGSGSIHGDLA